MKIETIKCYPYQIAEKIDEFQQLRTIEKINYLSTYDQVQTILMIIEYSVTTKQAKRLREIKAEEDAKELEELKGQEWI